MQVTQDWERNRVMLSWEFASLLHKLLWVKCSICLAARGTMFYWMKNSTVFTGCWQCLSFALLCFNYVWHSSHTIIQWKQIEEMQLHLKSNQSEDTCNYTVIYYYLETVRFLGLIYLWLPSYHPTPISCLDCIVKKPQSTV